MLFGLQGHVQGPQLALDDVLVAAECDDAHVVSRVVYVCARAKPRRPRGCPLAGTVKSGRCSVKWRHKEKQKALPKASKPTTGRAAAV